MPNKGELIMEKTILNLQQGDKVEYDISRPLTMF